MVEITDILNEYGLEDKEVKIYLLLVRERELTAYEVAKKTGIHRSTTYDLLDKLVEKGFVSSVIKRKTKYYLVNELDKILSTIKEKETMIMSLLPQIEMLKKGQGVSVELLEGVEGQRVHNYTIFELAKKGQINSLYTLGNTPASTISSEIYIERLIRELKKMVKKVDYKGIWNEKYKHQEIIKKYGILGRNKFLSTLPSNVGTVIYGDYVSLMFTIEKPYIIRIKNRLVAEEYRAYFKQFWKIAKS